MAGEEYCISAGAFARMCQTTRDTLRYYEKQGILVPKKSEKNGYHYYSYAQISSYYFISTFRGLGCSVEDIKEYLLGGEEVRFDGFVDRQYAALLTQQRELERRIGIIGNTRKLLEQIRKNDTGKPELYEQPEIFSIKGNKSTLRSGDLFQRDFHRHSQTSERMCSSRNTGLSYGSIDRTGGFPERTVCV